METPYPPEIYDGETAARIAWWQAELARMAHRFEDVGIRSVGSDDVQLRGRHRGRPVRVNVGVDAGWLTVATKFINRVGTAFLVVDTTGAVHDVSPEPGWGDERVLVFGHGVHAKGPPRQVALAEATMGALRDDVRADITHRIADVRSTPFIIDAEHVEGCFGESLYYASRSREDVLDRLLELESMVAAALSEGPGPVDPLPRMWSGGQPVVTAVERIVCAHCGTRYIVANDPRCSHCGAPPA